MKQASNIQKRTPKIKIGRSCFSCKYRNSGRARDRFIGCSKRKGKTWVNARCSQWRITNNPSRLNEYERHVDTKNLIQEPTYRSMYYGKKTKKSKDTTLYLGMCCVTCRHRGKLTSNRVQCNKLSGEVWSHAVCRYWWVENDWKVRLPNYRKQMKRAGADVDGIATWITRRQPREFFVPAEGKDYYETISSEEYYERLKEKNAKWAAETEYTPPDYDAWMLIPLKDLDKYTKKDNIKEALEYGWDADAESYEEFMKNRYDKLKELDRELYGDMFTD